MFLYDGNVVLVVTRSYNETPKRDAVRIPLGY